MVLVPFYRGAVVFLELSFAKYVALFGSRPLLSRSGCILNLRKKGINGLTVLVPFYRGAVVFHNRQKIEYWSKRFSSPFIEERLYFIGFYACGYNGKAFSSPFIEERLYFLL